MLLRVRAIRWVFNSLHAVGELETKPLITFTRYTPDEGTLNIPHKINFSFRKD